MTNEPIAKIKDYCPELKTKRGETKKARPIYIGKLLEKWPIHKLSDEIGVSTATITMGQKENIISSAYENIAKLPYEKHFEQQVRSKLAVVYADDDTIEKLKSFVEVSGGQLFIIKK